MPRYIMEGHGIFGASFDENGLRLDVDKVNMVLNTDNATTFSYEYLPGTNKFIDVDIAGNFTLKFAGEDITDTDFDIGFGVATWGAGRSTQVFGLEIDDTVSFNAPVAGDRIPNLAGDNGHVAIEFFVMTDATGTFKKVKSGPFAEGKDISLRDIFQDTTTGAFKQGKNDSERLVGGARDDLIVAQRGADEVVGKGGRDTLMLGRGNDEGYGGAGGDVITGYIGDDLMWGQSGGDVLFGDLGDDKLYGGAGKDRLFGGENADRIDGGQGNDRLTGDGGKDAFVFKIKGDKDVIRDFGQGQDRLKLDDKLFGNISEQQVVNRYAEKSGGNIVFDFGAGDKLVLQDYTKLGSLADFIDII